MKPFTSVARPHRDILEGRFTLDVYAASLWQVIKKEAPPEYQDPDIFFKRTELTRGLRDLIARIQKRLEGKGGDPVLQLQTPFGGGKTHALIALYHKVREWGGKVVAIDGEALNPKEDLLWEVMEKQLTGKVQVLKGKTSPGTEKIVKLLKPHQPVLILMDEILEYTTKAAGIKVGDSTLAAQVFAFVQELTSAASTLEKAALVFSLPSSRPEHYDEKAEELFRMLQRIVGRRQRIFAPVEDDEVPAVVRKRLFSKIDEQEAKQIVDELVDYFEEQNILPEGVEKSTYRAKFLKSYPFLPEVIDVLYQRWGTYSGFKRTRGVLRLLALVVHSLRELKKPYISLADFDLANQEIRRELLSYAGSQFDGVISQDITDQGSAAKRVDKELGSEYVPYFLGTRASTAIFMYSFAGGAQKRGATINEVKRACAEPKAIPGSIVADVIDKLQALAFYLWEDDGRFCFTAQPNLNSLLAARKEAVKDSELKAAERELLSVCLGRKIFDVYIWPKNSKDVPDTPKLKLVVLDDPTKKDEILEYVGKTPRVRKNTLIFLIPVESERLAFEDLLRTKLALESIERDEKLSLTPEQKSDVRKRLTRIEEEVKDGIGGLYRKIWIPGRRKEGYDLGRPTYGMGRLLSQEIYDRLKDEDVLAVELHPQFIRSEYLKKSEFVETKNILDSLLNTPGKMLLYSEDVLRECIKKGVKEGLFGLGFLEDGTPIPKYFETEFTPSLAEDEIVINEKLCKPKKPEDELEKIEKEIEKAVTPEELESFRREILPKVPEKVKPKVLKKFEERKKELAGPRVGIIKGIELELEIPAGQLSHIVRMLTYLRERFSDISIGLSLKASNGQMTETEYTDKITETLHQISGINVKKERKI